MKESQVPVSRSPAPNLVRLGERKDLRSGDWPCLRAGSASRLVSFRKAFESFYVSLLPLPREDTSGTESISLEGGSPNAFLPAIESCRVCSERPAADFWSGLQVTPPMSLKHSSSSFLPPFLPTLACCLSALAQPTAVATKARSGFFLAKEVCRQIAQAAIGNLGIACWTNPGWQTPRTAAWTAQSFIRPARSSACRSATMFAGSARRTQTLRYSRSFRQQDGRHAEGRCPPCRTSRLTRPLCSM